MRGDVHGHTDRRRPSSRAAHSPGASPSAHVPFSSSGDPTVPDGTGDRGGIAVKLYLDGGATDVIGITLPSFFVHTGKDLIEINIVRRPDPDTGAPDMAKVGAFLGEHPETVPAVTAAITPPIPASYAQLTYHALHTFKFVARRHGASGPVSLHPRDGRRVDHRRGNGLWPPDPAGRARRSA